jgi:hypothetical protein
MFARPVKEQTALADPWFTPGPGLAWGTCNCSLLSGLKAARMVAAFNCAHVSKSANIGAWYFYWNLCSVKHVMSPESGFTSV